MKSLKFIIIFTFLLIISSCSNLFNIEKRHYNKGWHISFLENENTKVYNRFLNEKKLRTFPLMLNFEEDTILSNIDTNLFVVQNNLSNLDSTSRTKHFLLSSLFLKKEILNKTKPYTKKGKTPDPFDLISIGMLLAMIIGVFFGGGLLLLSPLLVIPTIISLKKLRKGIKNADVWFYFAMLSLVFSLYSLGFWAEFWSWAYETTMFYILPVIITFILSLIVFYRDPYDEIGYKDDKFDRKNLFDFITIGLTILVAISSIIIIPFYIVPNFIIGLLSLLIVSGSISLRQIKKRKKKLNFWTAFSMFCLALAIVFMGVLALYLPPMSGWWLLILIGAVLSTMGIILFFPEPKAKK